MNSSSSASGSGSGPPDAPSTGPRVEDNTDGVSTMSGFVYILCGCLFVLMLLSLLLHIWQKRRLQMVLTEHNVFVEQNDVYREDLRNSYAENSEWICRICHFHNHPKKNTCLLCQTDRLNHDEKSNPISSSLSSSTDVKDLSISKQSLISSTKAPTTHDSIPVNLTKRQLAARRRLLWKRIPQKGGKMQWVRDKINESKEIPIFKSQIMESQLDLEGGETLEDFSNSLYADTPVMLERTSTSTSIDDESIMNEVEENIPTISEAIDRESTASVGYLRVTGENGEIGWYPTDQIQTDYSYSIDIVQNSNVGKLVVDLAGVATLPYQSKIRWFTSELHRLWLPWEFGHAEFSVRRDHVLEDSFKHVMDIHRHQLRQRWRVTFTNEPGLDAGGVMREWISILCQELFDPKFGLFIPTTGGDTNYWINATSQTMHENHLKYYEFAGRIFGKAILEEYLVPIHLALPFLKHIIGTPISFSDLQFLDEEVYNNMKWMKEHDQVDVLELDFTTTEIENGKPKVVELIENGSEKLVTDVNKQEFLEVFLKYRMMTSVSKQLQSFMDALFEVIPQDLLRIFDYPELELLFCGVPQLDIEDWKQHTDVRYVFQERPSSSETNNVKWFWEIMTEFDENERTRLLQFVTGSSRVPAQGFKALISNDGHVRRFNLVMFGVPSRVGYLPKAHTCFNRLDLPIYKSKAEMKQYLTLIVRMDITGFTIE